MSWSNYGKWHIDHIIPCAAFDLSDEFEQRACFHYSNLQPLWAYDNIGKSDKYDESEKIKHLAKMKNMLDLFKLPVFS